MKLTSLYGLLIVAVALSASHAVSFSAETVAKSNSKTWTKNYRQSVSRRHRREVSPSQMTAVEIREIVDRHNALRAVEGADNMELMVRTTVVSWSFHRYSFSSLICNNYGRT